MTQTDDMTWSDGIEQVVANDLRFKAQLDIGEEAFASLKLKRYLLDALDAGNGAITGAAIAKSSFVASTFFAPSGLLGALGLGTAVTPLGWAIAAGALGAGLSVIIGKKFVRGNSSRVKVIPEFINTPLDLLAVGLFDMIATLGMKLAAIDAPVDDAERALISHYFVNDWGYDADFVQAGLAKISHELEQHSLEDVARKLASYKKDNPDCNYRSMSAEILRFLDRIIALGGHVDTREQEARDRIKAIFDDAAGFRLGSRISQTAGNLTRTGLSGVGRLGKGTRRLGDKVLSGVTRRGRNKDGH
ncbi:hypothetical protein [Marinobacterium weihaiense]|uniref:Tellurite resistance protein TerB n=1 Tax=Marinobacterium weihaiense TaxID=2851016 RepID=A0ABS6M736_9GAMM|nr:hypothetical protein [Marinobacterium weihaiense]MBV0932084.1 hypothetical protein [Marinobacterium weihaiense]